MVIDERYVQLKTIELEGCYFVSKQNPHAEPSLSGWDGISAHYMPPSKMLIITQCCDVLPNNLLNYADVVRYVDSVKYAKAILYG